MIRNHFKTAWRSMWKNSTTSIINIAGLSVGMTAAVLILLWVQNETSFDNYTDKQQIYRLTTRLPSKGWVWESTPLLLADAIRNDVPGIEKVTRLSTNNLPVFKVKGNVFFEKACAYVDKDWFSFFKYDFQEGNPALFNDHPFSVILSKSEAKKYCGEGSAIGQIIQIDTIDYRVTAVVADAPVNSTFQYKAYIPIAALLTNVQVRENDEQWGNANYITFIKTIAGATPAVVAQRITDAVRKKAGDNTAAPTDMISLADMHFETEIQNSIFVHGNRNTIYIFSFLGFLLLLIACINYVNLTTAKAGLRAREVSIRKMSGATRSSLFLQFVIESGFINLLSLVTTIVLVQLCLPLFNKLTGTNFVLPLTSAALWKVLVLTLTTSLLLNSVYPALLLSSFKPLSVFRGSTMLHIKDSSFRRVLVVLQFTVCVILIAGTMVIYKQMRFVQKSNPGYNRSQVLACYLPFNIGRQNRQSITVALKQELLAQNGIESVSSSSQSVVDMGSYCTECADWAGRDTSYNPKIAQLSADADFQKTMQLQMKEGRWFGADRMDTKSFILNETAVRDFKLRVPALGQTFIFKGDTGHLIGIVRDFTYKSMHEKVGPLVIFNNPQWRNQLMIRSSGKNSATVLASIEKVWKKYLAGSPFEYAFLDDTFNNLYKKDQQTSFLIMVFAGIAVVISALGLLSLTAFAAEQRRKEIGIRKVLGATITGITALLSKDFVRLVCISIAIAIPVAWWAMHEWLQAFAYRIAIRWWMFATAALIAMVIALCTISFQAIKAAMANPARSLRSE